MREREPTTAVLVKHVRTSNVIVHQPNQLRISMVVPTKEGRGLMPDCKPIMVPISEAARCVLRQSARSITPSVNLLRRHRPTATLSRSPRSVRSAPSNTRDGRE
jgi:hypothetical protein